MSYKVFSSKYSLFSNLHWKTILFILLLTLWQALVYAQEIEQIQPDSVSSSVVAFTDSLMNHMPVDSSSKSTKEKDPARYPWAVFRKIASTEVLTDSLWRWNYYSDLADRLMELPQAMPYRTGILGRADASSMGGHDPRFQRISWGLMPMQDPLSRVPLIEFIPINKVRLIQQQSWQGFSDVGFENRIYQVREPWTRLYFDESDGDYQNLEFMITRNFGRRHNLEIGYRQQRDGNLFRTSDSETSQIFFQNSFFLNNKMRLTHRYLSNDFNVDEPFGYQFDTVSSFAFNPFSSTPVFQSRQNTTFNVHQIRFEHRSDSLGSAQFEAEYYRKNYQRYLRSAVDTLDIQVITHGLSLQKRIQLPILEGKLDVSFRSEFNDLGSKAHPLLNEDKNWVETAAKVSSSVILRSRLELFNAIEIGFTNPQQNALTQALSIGVRYQNLLKSGSSLQSSFFRRTEVLSIEEIANLGSGAFGYPEIERFGAQFNFGFPLTKKMHATIDAGYVNTKNSVLMAFRYNNLSLNTLLINPFVEEDLQYANLFFEWEPSTLYTTYSIRYQLRSIDTLQEDDRLFSRWVLGWKNYAFNKATFIDLSAELRNEFLPFYGLARDPIRNTWQIQNYSLIPAFSSALDIKLSARLRSMMILVRWENILDQATQLGYFETIGYPAPNRRLLFSVRALFKN